MPQSHVQMHNGGLKRALIRDNGSLKVTGHSGAAERGIATNGMRQSELGFGMECPNFEKF